MLLGISNKTDYVVMIIIAIVLIIGVYQFYFWCQRNAIRKPIQLESFVDRYFKFKPWWIWIYSGIYYPIIVVTIFSFKDFRQFDYTVVSYIILLAIQMLFFLFFPVHTPPSWREQPLGNSLTHRFLRYVQSLDMANNCFPSMHMSVSTLTSFHLATNCPPLGLWIWSFPVLIAFSALYTKQHFFLDLIPGAIVGWIAFETYLFIYV
ncbi:MAG TPA: phosphatase PAP2 family protein [Prolixibacteraceae bacterium]